MAYGQLAQTANIVIEKNGGTVLYTGPLVFHPLPSDVASYVTSRAYGDVNTGYSGDGYDRVMAGAIGTIYHTFLWDNLTAAGQYIDIYNANFGKNIKLRYYCVSRTTYLKINVYLIVFGYQSTLESNHAVAGRDDADRPRYYLLNGYIDADNGYGMLSCELALPESRYVNLLGCWSGGTSELNMIKQSLYILFTSGGGGGGGGNPYADGGLNTDPAGGEDQNFDETSDIIPEPTLPSNPATGSGFITAYVPTLQEINDVADYLIDPNVLQALANTVLKLSDVVVGLSVFPFVITATGYQEIKINLCGVHLTTGVSSHYSNSQFVTLDMGSLEVKKYWDNCLDFDPFTSISLYLPYIGYVDLDTDEVMGKTIQVKYNIDIFTGCCLALVIVDSSVMYQFPGECSCQIPVTSVSFDSFLQSAINLGIAAASGAEAVKGGQALVDKATDTFMKASGRKQIFDAQEKMWEAEAGLDAIKTSAHEQLALAGVSAVMSAKGQYSHAGAMSSCAGILGTQKPFLIIKRPKQCMPEGYESIRGFPCNMKKTLGDLSGYTEVGDIHLNIPNATVEEIVECERFLKGGVFL